MNTAANISEWLDQRSKGLKLPDCMAHRHFRLLTDKNGKVMCQARSSAVVSYTSEPWQGLEANTNFHDLFPYGIPDLYKDAVPLML